jgi:hypothetical protein
VTLGMDSPAVAAIFPCMAIRSIKVADKSAADRATVLCMAGSLLRLKALDRSEVRVHGHELEAWRRLLGIPLVLTLPT